jgi:plasmid stabilization system protein ParE
MGLAVFWTNFAKKELRNIFDYYNKTISLKIAKQIVKQLITKANILRETRKTQKYQSVS